MSQSRFRGKRLLLLLSLGAVLALYGLMALIGGQNSAWPILAGVWMIGALPSLLLFGVLGSLLNFARSFNQSRQGATTQSRLKAAINQSGLWLIGALSGGLVTSGIGLLLYLVSYWLGWSDGLMNGLRQLPGQRHQYEEVFLVSIGLFASAVTAIPGVFWGAKLIQQKD
jgi:hypothetical protein